MSVVDQHMTREDWLRSAAAVVVEWSNIPAFPVYYIAVGYPSGGRRGGALGYTMLQGPTQEANHIFISPEITSEQGSLAFSTLVHELAHVASQCRHAGTQGHGDEFGIKAALLGLLPPWETTPTHLPALDEMYRAHVATYGEYPHSALVPKPIQKGQMTKWICTGAACKEPGTDKEKNVIVYATTRRKLNLFCIDCGTVLVLGKPVDPGISEPEPEPEPQ